MHLLRRNTTVDYTRLLGHLTVDKEEELVLDDGTAQGHTVGRHLEFLACLTNLRTLDCVTAHILVAVEEVSASAEGVGTTLGDGVQATTDKVGLTHIVGRDNNLHLLDGLDRNRVATARKVAAQTEVVVEVSTKMNRTA